MLKLPSWVKQIFDKLTCPHCRAAGKTVALQEKNVVSIGIKECVNAKTHKKFLAFLFEVKCNTCKKCCNNILNANPIKLEDFIDFISEVTIHQYYPLIDDELLGLKLNFNCLKHLNGLEDVLESLGTKGSASEFMAHYQTFHCSLDLNS